MNTGNKEIIGFIGLGVMGASMATLLLKAGYEVHVSTRTPEKAESVIQAGAQWHEKAEDVAAQCSIVITMLGYPSDVESVYGLSAGSGGGVESGEGGLLQAAHSGTLLIDMTTSCPVLARNLAEQAQANSLACLDAPVSGGDIGARNGTLSIMVGGEQKDFTRALPLFEVLGRSIVLQGPAGSGQHTKMTNQIAIAPGMLGVCEAMIYAKQAGLDQSTVLDCISGGAAGSWSLSNLAPRMIAGDISPGFFVKHFVKDMKIAQAAAEALGLILPGLNLALQRYDELVAIGGEELGTQALYRLYENAGVSPTA